MYEITLTTGKKITSEQLLDKEWRLSNLYKITTKDGEKITFKRNKAQEDFNKNKTKRNIILKSRQLGFTTYEAIDNLDDMLFTPNFESLFIAHTKDEATEIFNRKVNFAWENIDENLKSLWSKVKDSATSLRMDYGDGTISAITVDNSGRSGTYQRVHISELAKLSNAFPERALEIIKGTIPAVPVNGRLDIESTAEGMAGEFFELFTTAWERDREPLPTEFKAHFYNWQWDEVEIAKYAIVPIRNMDNSAYFSEYQEIHNLTDREISFYYQKWLEAKKDFDTLHQEYPTTVEEAFIASGTPYFNAELINKYLKTTAQEPIRGSLFDGKFIKDERGDISIWEKPFSGQQYVIGADVAEGVGGDFSVARVLDSKNKLVARFRSNTIDPHDFAEELYNLGQYYNWAFIGAEVNKDGLWVNDVLQRRDYPNLYYRETIDDVTKRVSKRIGWKTDQTTRPYMLAGLKSHLSENGDRDEVFLKECITFIKNKQGKAEAILGKHDDEVISHAIALQIKHQAPVSIIQQKITEIRSPRDMVIRQLNKLYGKVSLNPPE